MNWTTINKVAVKTADNESEVIKFEVTESGEYFRIINEYGNHILSFDVMTGFEAISRIQETFKSYIDLEIQKDFKSINSIDSSHYPDVQSFNDCQGEGV